jgi:hypothetical protein
MATHDPSRNALSAMRTLASRIRLGRRAWLAATISTVVAGGVALTTMTALGAFNAVITQNGTFTAGSIVLKETQGANTCYSTGGVNTGFTTNSSSCTTIDVFGAPAGQEPGSGVNTQTMTFQNVGSANASSFTVSAPTCSAAGTGSYYGNDTSGFCGHIDVTIGNGASVCYYPSQASACPALSSTDTLATLGAATTSTPITIGSGLASNATGTVVVKTQIDATNATNQDQGLQATQGFTWTLNQ